MTTVSLLIGRSNYGGLVEQKDYQVCSL